MSAKKGPRKATVLKAKYLPAYVETFEQVRDAFCPKCMMGSTHPCPAKGTPLCLRILAQAGVEFDDRKAL